MAMTLPSGSDQNLITNNTVSSSFLKTVCLHDWWLIKAEKDFNGLRLAVGGFTSREQQAIRVFSSAPIVKKYDAFTLETADGITVIIEGFINRSRTHQNGFPFEVCNHFLFGFPYDWMAYADECFGRESTSGSVPSCVPVFGEGSGNLTKNEARKHEKIKSLLDATDVGPELSGGNSSSLGDIGLEGIVKESLLPNVLHSEISERLGNCSYNTIDDLTTKSGVEMNINSPSKDGMDIANITPIKYGGRRAKDRLKNLKSNQKENPTSELCANNEDNEPSSISETFENPGGDKLTGRSFSNATIPSEGKMSSYKGIECQSESRRSSCGLKNLKNKLNEDQQINSRLENETNEGNPVSLDSDFVKNVINSVDCKTGGKNAVNLPDAGLQETKSELLIKELESSNPKHGAHLDCLFSSVSSNGTQEPLCATVTNRTSAESNDQHKLFVSPIGPGDVNHSNNLQVPVGKEESNAKKLSTSGRKAMRKLVSNQHASPPFARERMKKSTIVSPESLSFRRSRSGRLLVPTLAFWHNQQVVYDADGHITGIQGLPVVDSPKGSKSEVPRKKKKFI